MWGLEIFKKDKQRLTANFTPFLDSFDLVLSPAENQGQSAQNCQGSAVNSSLRNTSI
jgi:hypothetical protein